MGSTLTDAALCGACGYKPTASRVFQGPRP